LILVACLLALSQATPVWITLSESTFQQLKTIGNAISVHRQQPLNLVTEEALHIVQVDDALLPLLSTVRRMHGPGFMVHQSFEDAFEALEAVAAASTQVAAVYPAIRNDPKIKGWIDSAKASEVVSTIKSLSSFRNRQYRTEEGRNASNWLKQRWQEFAGNRQDVKVEQFVHKGWIQPSVILTIEGTDPKAGIVIIGGHMDSTAAGGNAPGADDNASGTSSVTEALRVLLANNFKPRRTLKFMGYAAEEGGLLGSQEIAKQAKADGTKIAGVMQMDMTNFKGSTGDIYFMTDFTTVEQTKYLTDLAKAYLPELTLGETKCGYACSDHASWFRQGFRTAFPAEAIMSQSSKKIHTAQDTLENADPTGNHALKFAKLAVAFGAELADSQDFQGE